MQIPWSGLVRRWQGYNRWPEIIQSINARQL
jgi:hypothetical protein